jgi:hypothetical protein
MKALLWKANKTTISLTIVTENFIILKSGPKEVNFLFPFKNITNPLDPKEKSDVHGDPSRSISENF